MMIKLPKVQLGKISRIPDQNQAVAAELREPFAQSEAAPYALSPDERAVMGRALARARRPEFADEADVDATLRRPWG